MIPSEFNATSCPRNYLRHLQRTSRECLTSTTSPQTKVVTVRPMYPWYNKAIRDAKRKQRQLDCQWRRTKLTIHRDLYTSQRELVHRLIISKKRRSYSHKVEDCASNQKQLFNIVGGLLPPRKDRSLPDHHNKEVPNHQQTLVALQVPHLLNSLRHQNLR